mgnify:CR=1 FL=1
MVTGKASASAEVVAVGSAATLMLVNVFPARRARDLGFGMAEIAELLKLWQNRRRASAEVNPIERPIATGRPSP